MCPNGLGGFCCEVGHLHRVLERSRCLLGKRVEEFRVYVGQFDQRNGRDEPEGFLEEINQSVATDSQKRADGKPEVHPKVDGRPDSGLGEGNGRIGDHLCQKNPSGRLHELCAARHIRERGDCHHSHHNLYEEELNRCRHDDGRDENGREMQEEGCTRIEEDAREDGHPRKGDEIDREVETQGETGKCDDNEHLQAEEKNRGCGAQILDTEDIEITDKEAKEQRDQYGLAQYGKRALPVAERFIVVSAPQGL